MEHSISRGMVILGVLLAVGMSAAAFIFGVQAKQIGATQQTITVKGVVEKAVDATNAEWSVTLKSRGEDFASALANLRREKPALEGFLAQYGFKAEALSYGAEDVQVHYETITNEQGREQSVQRGYDASMTVFVKTEDLQKVQEARDKIIDYQAQGHALDVGEVRFMVGNLSDIKLALIGEATKDAKIRADEFAKNGNAQVGTMRSASQGTFDILAADGDTDSGDGGGGSYSTSTVHKKVRVVVTIVYNTKN